MVDLQRTKYGLAVITLPMFVEGSVRVDWRGEEVSIPMAGITGLGSNHRRKDRESAWVNGQVLSPSFYRNDSCVPVSHMEGIFTDEGNLRVLLSPYGLPIHGQDCFEYNLKFRGMTPERIDFEGEAIQRFAENKGIPIEAGRVRMSFLRIIEEEEGTLRSMSLPYHSKRMLNDSGFPAFWNKFLEEIEDRGYEHPYQAVTEALKSERLP